MQSELEGRLSGVAKLSAATAKGWVRIKPLVKLLCTLVVCSVIKLSALWQSWKAGAAARSGGAEGSGAPSPPLQSSSRCLALVEQLAERGLEEKARKELAGVDLGDSVEAITHSEPPRGLVKQQGFFWEVVKWLGQPQRRRDSASPQGSGREEDIKGWLKGGGRGSGPEGGKGAQGAGESRKRVAGHRLSVAEPRAAKK